MIFNGSIDNHSGWKFPSLYINVQLLFGTPFLPSTAKGVNAYNWGSLGGSCYGYGLIGSIFKFNAVVIFWRGVETRSDFFLQKKSTFGNLHPFGKKLGGSPCYFWWIEQGHLEISKCVGRVNSNNNIWSEISPAHPPQL